jgi:hypothetical protein
VAIKPAPGTALDSGGAYYASLAAYYVFNEGSGTTTADAKGTRTGTLSSSALWATDGAGDPILQCNSAVAAMVALASALTLTGQTSGGVDWYWGVRFSLTADNDNGMLFGDNTNTTDFVWARGANYLRFRDHGNADADFTGVSSFTVVKDLFGVWDHGNQKARLWVDGTEVNSPGITTGAGNLTINTLGNGYTSNTFGFTGAYKHAFFGSGVLLGGTDASYFHTTPYGVFQAGGGGGSPFTRNVFARQAVNRSLSY